MARLKSEEKRQAILAAAAAAIAERGVSAPTSAIAKGAGVAEGSIFTYFADKDVLLNELYLSIKASLYQHLSEGYPARASIAERLEHVWAAYIAWGAAEPAQRAAMAQLAVSEKITTENRLEGERMFGDIGRLFEDGVAHGVIRQQPAGFTAGLVTTIAETTIAFMHRHPEQADAYRQAGFEAIWRSIAVL